MVKLGNETLFGHVTETQAGLFSITLQEFESDTPPFITIGGDDIYVGRVGSYIAVIQENRVTIAMVTRMTEREKLIPSAPGQKSADTDRDTGTVREIDASPVGSLNKNGEFERGVTHYPTTGAEAHILGNEYISKMFSRFESKGYEVGTLPALPTQSLFLDPSALFGRHFAILGQTGAGKSFTVATLLQRAVELMPNAHVILLDLHGEYSWIDNEGNRKYAFSKDVVRHVDARHLEIPYWLMAFEELCDFLVDHGESEAANQTAFFRDTLLDLKTEENNAVGLARVSVDTPIFFSLEKLIGQIVAKNEEMVPGKGSNLIKGPMKGDFHRFLMRIRSKMNDVRYDFLLKPKKRNNSASLEGLLRDFVGLGQDSKDKRAVTIIDLSSIPFDVRPTVSAQIGKIAFEFNYWNPQYREFPIALICEEAHAYIPRDSLSQYAGARKAMERIAKEGRKYGVGLGVVSQRPHEVSETVLSQCGSFLCLRITNPADQSYVKNLVPEAERNFLDTLSSMGRGEAMVLGEAAPLPSRVQFHLPDPEPNSNDVDFYEGWRNKLDDIDVANIVDKWRRQERGEPDA